MAATRAIGLVTHNFESTFTTPLIQRMQRRLSERGFRLIGIASTPAEVASSRIAGERVDGWLVLNQTEGAAQLAAAGKPIVLVCAVCGDLPHVTPENHASTAAAVEHLIAQGRTRIAFFTHAGNSDFAEREIAYAATLERHGLPVDPALIVEAGSYETHAVYENVKRMLAGGLQLDAAFCANDELAYGVMQALAEAGRRIPEDVAVVGFDDLTASQFTTPPLTSVRQNPAELGRVAADLIVDQVERGVAPPLHTAVAAELIVRASSMAQARRAAQTADARRYAGDDWRELLARDLVGQAIYPQQLADADRPAAIWPGVTALVDALAGVVGGAEDPAVPDGVWEQAYALTRGGELMAAVIDGLRAASVERLGDAPRAAVDRVTRWLLECQRVATTAQARVESGRAEYERQFFRRETDLLGQIAAGSRSVRDISWLETSLADWGVLGLWQPPAGDRLAIEGVYARGAGMQPADLAVDPAQFPPLELLAPAVRDSLDYHLKLTPLGGKGRMWGYLAYAERALSSVNETVMSRTAYIASALEREELVRSLHERQLAAQAAYERERSLAATVRELGCPVIPLRDGVLLVPLIGTIDSARAAQIVERVLEGISQERAERVLLDITGVPLVDTQVAAALMQAAQAAALLGARVGLVGVRPEIAQSIVGLGIDLRSLGTYPTLATALHLLETARRG